MGADYKQQRELERRTGLKIVKKKKKGKKSNKSGMPRGTGIIPLIDFKSKSEDTN